jgi:hypothetical protein
LQLRQLQRDTPSLLLEVFASDIQAGPQGIGRPPQAARHHCSCDLLCPGLSGVWRKEQEPSGGASVEYSAQAVDEARQLLAKQEADCDMLLREVGVEPLTLWYEDAVERPGETVASVARFSEC